MATGRCATVKQMRDLRMLQVRQQLPFARETRRRVGIHDAANQLDRSLLLKMSVGALGQIHRTHAAVTDLAHKPPRAEHIAGIEFGGAELGDHRSQRLA